MHMVPPINRLPNEILYAIFTAGHPSDDRELSVFLARVGATCILWRQIIIQIAHVCARHLYHRRRF